VRLINGPKAARKRKSRKDEKILSIKEKLENSALQKRNVRASRVTPKAGETKKKKKGKLTSTRKRRGERHGRENKERKKRRGGKRGTGPPL